MESITKMRLTEQVIGQMVERIFGSGIEISSCIELGEGWFNTAYSIDLSDGRGTVLKLSPPEHVRTLRYEHNLMEAEVSAMRLIHEAGGVPIPVVYGYDDTKELAPCRYFFQERLAGRTYNHVRGELTEAENNAIEIELGGYNAKLNEIKGESFGYLAQTESHRSSWREAFGVMIDWVLQDGKEAGVELPVPYEQVRAIVEAHADTLDDVTSPRLVFWDLWEGNLFVNEGHITGIIDAERALWGDPLMEHSFSHFANRAAFLQGYGIPSPAADSRTNRRRLLYDLYLALVLRIESSYRQYDDNHTQWTADNLAERIDALRHAE